MQYLCYVVFEIEFLTCKSLDVCEEDGDLLVAVDVDLVELVGLEVAVVPLLLLGSNSIENA